MIVRLLQISLGKYIYMSTQSEGKKEKRYICEGQLIQTFHLTDKTRNLCSNPHLAINFNRSHHSRDEIFVPCNFSKGKSLGKKRPTATAKEKINEASLASSAGCRLYSINFISPVTAGQYTRRHTRTYLERSLSLAIPKHVKIFVHPNR